MQIKAKKEGRDGIYIPEKESLKDFIKNLGIKKIHNFIPSRMMMLGADHSLESVLIDIDNSDRLAILTGNNFRNNMNHALSIIKNNKMEMFDIGEIKDQDIEIIEQEDE